MLKMLDIIEVKPGSVFLYPNGDRDIYLGEFYLNFSRLKLNEKSITTSKLKIDSTKEESKRTIVYRISKKQHYHKKELTYSYLQENESINEFCFDSAKLESIDERFSDLSRNADIITLDNIKNHIIQFQGTMNYISVSTDFSTLNDVYKKNIKIFNEILKENGKKKTITFCRKNRLKFPFINKKEEK